MRDERAYGSRGPYTGPGRINKTNGDRGLAETIGNHRGPTGTNGNQRGPAGTGRDRHGPSSLRRSDLFAVQGDREHFRDADISSSGVSEPGREAEEEGREVVSGQEVTHGGGGLSRRLRAI